MAAGDIGLVAKLVDTVFGWFTDEAGYLELKKRRAIASKKKECQRDLANNDFVALAQHTAELERLCNEA